MSRLTLRLPETLHQQLSHQASQEGVSLNQYIVYALTRQVSQNYVVESVAVETLKQQNTLFQELVNSLGHATPEELQAALGAREIVGSEPELNPAAIVKLQQKIEDQN